MSAKARMIVVFLGFLSLAFSCAEGGSYVVDTTESSRLVSVLDHWASDKGFTATDCAKYFNFPTAIKGTCFEDVRPGGVTESVLIAEELEPGRSVRVWISFRGTAESQRIKTLDNLGAALASEFGAGRVRLEE